MIRKIATSRGRRRAFAASTSASMIDAPGICLGGSQRCGGRSSLATGFAASTSRFTSHPQKLESVD
jgi:hypothetical protein